MASITGNKPKATPAQVQYLHGLYRAVGWDKEQYKFVLDCDYKAESTKDLTMYEASELIKLLRSIVNAEQSVCITPKQCTFIRAEWLPIDYSNGEKGDLHLNAFIQKRFKKGSLEKLTKAEATKLIRMIKAMQKQAKEREGKTTILNKLVRCEYCGCPIMWVQLKSGERVPFDCKPAPDATEGRDKYVATDFHTCKQKQHE